MERHEWYAKYKTAPTPEEREEARQRYLDERGVLQSFRWTTSPWKRWQGRDTLLWMVNKRVMIAAISLKVGAPHLVLLRSSLFSVKIKMKNFAYYKMIENRAAGIADTVQRGLGMLPQQAICEDWSRGKIEKMSEPVQVYTACRFVKRENINPCEMIFSAQRILSFRKL